MYKAGFHDINNPIKPAGDALETIIAAFYTEQGLEAFQSYAKLYFVPLIQIASQAYDGFRYVYLSFLSEKFSCMEH
jgi:hypothetical protein